MYGKAKILLCHEASCIFLLNRYHTAKLGTLNVHSCPSAGTVGLWSGIQLPCFYCLFQDFVLETFFSVWITAFLAPLVSKLLPLWNVLLFFIYVVISLKWTQRSKLNVPSAMMIGTQSSFFGASRFALRRQGSQLHWDSQKLLVYFHRTYSSGPFFS